MKKITFQAFLLVALFAGISSCSKEPITIKYDIGTKEACVPADPYQKYYTYTFVIQQADLKAAAEAAGAKWDMNLIKAVNMKGFKAQVNDSNKNLDQIASVEVYVRKDGATTDGTQIAYSDTKANGAKEVTLLPQGVDLKSWLSEDHINLFVKVLNSEAGNDAICLNLASGYVELEVSAK